MPRAFQFTPHPQHSSLSVADLLADAAGRDCAGRGVAAGSPGHQRRGWSPPPHNPSQVVPVPCLCSLEHLAFT